MTKRIVFLTGTRADFGKIRSLIDRLTEDDRFDVHLFVTGMHMLRKYGYTCNEIEKRGYRNLYKYINQNLADTMDSVLGKTIGGFSDYVKEIQPDMIVVHGDRVEALAGAIVGSLNNILVSHIEGGEVSGTIDDLIRHSISKLSHLHFVTNDRAKQRLIQLGESDAHVFVIGSPDIDILFSPEIPSMDEVRKRYQIPFESYAVLLFHPVTTELDSLDSQLDCIESCVKSGEDNYVVIYPNNDSGSDRIIERFERLSRLQNVRIFPSMRFEHFLSTMKNAQFMLGNSSSALMEAPYYGVPAINVGSRQNNRAKLDSVFNTTFDKEHILKTIRQIKRNHFAPINYFGSGESSTKFYETLDGNVVWNADKQKVFVDL